MSPTPKEKILQKFKSTSLEKPTKSTSTKLHKPTESTIPTTPFDEKNLNKINISASKPGGWEGGGRLKFEPHTQRENPTKYPTKYEK